MFFSRRSGHRVVDTGDVSLYHYQSSDFIKDGEWQALDLSDKIPIGTKLVCFTGNARSSVAFSSGMFKTYGNTNNANAGIFITQYADENIDVNFCVAPNKDRKIVYKLSNVTWGEINLTVCRYFG